MNPRSLFPHLGSLFVFAAPAFAAVSTGNPFYGDPPDAHHPWAIHDRNRPQPVRVEPGTFSTPEQPGNPPSDAIVLFDGTEGSLANWEADTAASAPSAPPKWVVKNGAVECVPKSGFIRTKAKFADCQLHVEWAAPSNVQGDSQGRGNSGIFLCAGTTVGPTGIEVQVLDSYNNPTYADGFAAAVYGTNPPLANALRPPGVFQVYDIIFRRPVYREGKAVDPGYLTVFCNGVLVQDHTPLEGGGGHLKRTAPAPFPESGALKLQDHGNPVRYRNIWYRPLPPRSVEGGTDGMLSTEATQAKRRQIAASIRADAEKMTGKPVDHMLRLAESLYYEKDPAASAQVEKMAAGYVADVKSASSDALEQRKAEIQEVNRAFKYLAKWNVIPESNPTSTALDGIEKKQGWNQKKKG